MSRRRFTALARLGLPLLPLLLGLVLLLQGGWIQAKAIAAQWLIDSAWEQTLADGQRHPPWGWADHWPVAEIEFAAQGKRFIVAEGDQGNTLAFAPGHSPQSGLPGEGVTTIFSGHRDTHFSVLKALKVGDEIHVKSLNGAVTYRVDDMEVVDSRKTEIPVAPVEELVLVTCWPFEATAVGGPMRYVVYASAVAKENESMI